MRESARVVSQFEMSASNNVRMKMAESSQPVTVDIPLLRLQSVSLTAQNDIKLRVEQLYRALRLDGPRCIRVLDVEAAESLTDPVRGNLRVVDLSTSPGFTALSYVWGDATCAKLNISCNGVEVPITQSCHEALCALRSIYGRITIWIDAVCIHQGNDDEKKTQIPLMHEIFTWAQAVYVWLGPGTDQTDKVMDWFSRVTTYQPSTPGIPWTAGRKCRSLLSDRVQSFFEVFQATFLSTVTCMCHLRLP